MKREYSNKIKQGILNEEILLLCLYGADKFAGEYAYLAKKWKNSGRRDFYLQASLMEYEEHRDFYVRVKAMIQRVLLQEREQDEISSKLQELKKQAKETIVSKNVVKMVYELLRKKDYTME